MDRKETAEYLGRDVDTIYEYDKKRKPDLKPFKEKGRVYYWRSNVDAVAALRLKPRSKISE